MDFVEVMRAQQRMCETVGDCENCPLNHFHCGPDACENEDELREYEERVTTWARENEPYPTVRELFEYIREAMGYKDNVSFDNIADKYIPPRVARDLGLTPISTKYARGEWAP